MCPGMESIAALLYCSAGIVYHIKWWKVPQRLTKHGEPQDNKLTKKKRHPTEERVIVTNARQAWSLVLCCCNLVISGAVTVTGSPSSQDLGRRTAVTSLGKHEPAVF